MPWLLINVCTSFGRGPWSEYQVVGSRSSASPGSWLQTDMNPRHVAFFESAGGKGEGGGRRDVHRRDSPLGFPPSFRISPRPRLIVCVGAIPFLVLFRFLSRFPSWQFSVEVATTLLVVGAARAFQGEISRLSNVDEQRALEQSFPRNRSSIPL